jgi:hypothetical protein
VDQPDTSGEAAELDADAGIGQREDGVVELRRKGSRGLRERQKNEQFGGGAAPVGRATEETANGIDKGVGWGWGFEGFPHMPRGAIQGWGSGLGPGQGGGVAGSG